MKKILFLTTVYPFSKITGGEIVTSEFISALSDADFSIDLVCYGRKSELRSLHKSVSYHIAKEISIETKYAGLWPAYWLSMSLIFNLPYSVQKFVSISYRRIVKQLLNDNEYDKIIIDHAQMAWIQDFLPKNTEIIFIAHNSEASIYKQLAGQTEWSTFYKYCLYCRESRLINSLERKISKRSSQVWFLSNEDKEIFKNNFNLEKGVVLDVPIHSYSCISMNSEQAPPIDAGMIGTWSWQSNQKGLEWFLYSVMPHLCDSVRVSVAGKGANWIVNYGYQNLEYKGFVKDASDFLGNCKVILIPSVAGSGVQVKTIEAITIGRPIIATSVAVRGIRNLPSYVEIIDDPLEFSKAVQAKVGAYNSTNCREYLKEGSSWLKCRKASFYSLLKNCVS